jgi:hypothetical protein
MKSAPYTFMAINFSDDEDTTPEAFTYISQVDVSSPQLKGKFANPKVFCSFLI